MFKFFCYTTTVEQKIIIKMLLGFVAVTVVMIGGLYVMTLDLPLLTIAKKSPTPTAISQPIIIPPKPTPAIIEPTPNIQSTTTNQVLGAETTIFDKEALYSLINAHRKEQKLPILRTHISLEQSAKRKLEEMIALKYWKHENPDGVMNWQVFEQSGYYYETAGENLSFSNNTPWEVFSSWLASPLHNEQLLKSEYEDMGLAVDCTTYSELGTANCVVVLHLGKHQY